MAFDFEEIRAVIRGRHRDPHTVLGPHAEADGMVVRALNPEAAGIAVLLTVADGIPLRFAMKKEDDAGLFEVSFRIS